MTELVVVAFATGFFRDGRVVRFHRDLAHPAASIVEPRPQDL